jgi:hypothetical protein
MPASFTKNDRLLGTAGTDDDGKKGFALQLSGAANGATSTAPPVVIAGIDDNPFVRQWHMSAVGAGWVSLGTSTAGASGVANTLLFGNSSNSGNLPLAVVNHVFNGATLDEQRGDTTGTYTVAKPGTSGGLSLSRVVTGTTGVIKASAGQAYWATVYNVNAAVRYLHLYNKATAPTLSTDTPVLTIPLMGAGVRDINITALGAEFTTGISWAYTTDDIAIPTTAGTSTELHATFGYK